MKLPRAYRFHSPKDQRTPPHSGESLYTFLEAMVK